MPMTLFRRTAFIQRILEQMLVIAADAQQVSQALANTGAQNAALQGQSDELLNLSNHLGLETSRTAIFTMLAARTDQELLDTEGLLSTTIIAHNLPTATIGAVHYHEGRLRKQAADELNNRYRQIIREHLDAIEESESTIEQIERINEGTRERITEETRHNFQYYLPGLGPGLIVNAVRHHQGQKRITEQTTQHEFQRELQQQALNELYLDLLDSIQDWIREHPKYERTAGGNFNRENNGLTWCNQATYDYVSLTSPRLFQVMTNGGSDRSDGGDRAYNTRADNAVYNLFFRNVPENRRPALNRATGNSLATDENYSTLETLLFNSPHTNRFMGNAEGFTNIQEVSEQRAQELANQGYTVVGVQFNNNVTLSGEFFSGHVAVVRRDRTPYDAELGALFSNVGGNNGILYRWQERGSFAFTRNLIVRYYYDPSQPRLQLEDLSNIEDLSLSNFWGYPDV